MTDDLDDLVTGLLAGGATEGSQLVAFEQAFRDRGRFPFSAHIIGTAVEVVSVEFSGRPRRGLTAVCRQRRGQSDRVLLADLIPGPVTVPTARLLDAYWRWLGRLPAEPQSGAESAEAWVYRPVAREPANFPVPLGLQPMGTWDPAEQHWGEEGAEIEPLYQRIIAAGPRPQFEMEQVVPGDDDDDLDFEAMEEALELYDAGQGRAAIPLLEDLVEQDARCIDAWVHLGAIAFDVKGPQVARDYYESPSQSGSKRCPTTSPGCSLGASSTIVRSSAPSVASGYVPGGSGVGRTRGLIFTNLAWIDGCETWTAAECLAAVEVHERWTRRQGASLRPGN